MLANPDPKLTFGALNLLGPESDLATVGYYFEAQGTDTDWGNPVPVTDKVETWLQDGAIVALKNYDNREILVRVVVVGNDLNDLAVGEAALMLETGKPNLLTWTPADGHGEPCVFSVQISSLEQAFNDIDEVRETPFRTYGLRLQAEPFVRSQDMVTVVSPAPSGAATITGLSITSSGTGWSSERVDPDGTTTAGGLAVSPPPIAATAASLLVGDTYLRAIKTGLSQSLSGSPYLRVKATVTVSGALLDDSGVPEFVVNGVALRPVAQYGDYYWLDTSTMGVITLTTLRVGVRVTAFAAGGSVTLRIEDVSRADEIDSGSTNRQLVRVLDIAGSARTQGSLIIEDVTPGGPIALGEVMVYTAPNAGGLTAPNLRQYLSSGNSASTAASLCSGFTTDLSDLHTFDVPASSLLPGAHLLLARVKPDNSGPLEFTWAAESRMGSTDLADGQSGVVTIDVNNGVYTIVTVADLHLPPRKVGPDGLVRIELTVDAGNTLLDEAWLFNVQAGRLTKVDCGIASPSSGGSANVLFIDAPTAETPGPGVYLGTDTDRSDAYHAALAELGSLEIHELNPPSASVYVVTTNSAQADVSFSHYRYFHTHVTAA